MNLDLEIYHEILEKSEDIFALFSPQGKLIDINAIGCKYLGNRREILCGKTISQIFTSKNENDISNKFEDGILKAINGVPAKFEIVSLSDESEEMIFQIDILPIEGKTNHQKLVLIKGREITQHKMMQNMLAESQLYYQSLFNLSDLSILIVEPQLGFTTGNKAALRLFGFENLSDFMKSTPASLSPEFQPDGQSSDTKAQKMMKIALEKGSHIFNWRHKKFNGQEFDCIIYLSKLPVNKKRNLMHVWIRDITEAKQKEKERQRLLQIIESTSDFVSTSDADEGLTYINPAGLKMLGRDPNSNYRYKSFYSLHPAWAQKIIQNEGLPVAITQGIWEGETAILNAEGIEIPVFQIIMSHNNEKGEIEYFSTIMRDITAQRHAELDRFRNQKLESLALLAGGIAHDFNNLLTSIMGSLSLLRVDKSEELIIDAEKAVIRATKLTKQLLSFAKGDNPTSEKLDMQSIIRDSANFVLHGSNCTIFFEIPTDLWQIYGDSGQIAQVIQNLVINAIQAMPNSGKVEIVAKNQVISLSNELNINEGEYIRIDVIDHGIGISEEHISRVFDPYFTTKSEGTGLGLSICLSIIKKHGGTITVESKLNSGTTFSIFLPCEKNQHIK